MEAPALALCKRLGPVTDYQLKRVVLKLDDETAGIITDIDGVDYLLTMTRVPLQRPRTGTIDGATYEQ